MSRVIGISHRVKKTKSGEARPTQICVSSEGSSILYSLETDTDELDFVRGTFPVAYRPWNEQDQLSDFAAHHIRWRALKDSEDPNSATLTVKLVEGKYRTPQSVPSEFDGLRMGDKVIMILGGSGDRLAFALTNRGKSVGATVHRITPANFADRRNNGVSDAELLVNIYRLEPALFYLVRPRDERLIAVRETLQLRTEALEARIACGNRLHSGFVGRIFLNPEGHYPEGNIEDIAASEVANDIIFQALNAEERARDRGLAKACAELDIYTQLFEPIEGVGPAIGARLISTIQDIRRFPTSAKLRKFLGCHVMPDGSFPRRRAGERCSWSTDARLALYLLGEQFNRRPNSVWGKKLREVKTALRAQHPEVVSVVSGFSAEIRRVERIANRASFETPMHEYEPSTVDGMMSYCQAVYSHILREDASIHPGVSAEEVAYVFAILSKLDGEESARTNVKIFTPGHIHKMGLWKTVSKFVTQLHHAWWKIENESAQAASEAA
jgi:hypothetical protein